MQFQPRILVCLASEQIMQNTLPALRLRPAQVIIAASDSEPALQGALQVSRVLHDAGWPADAVRIVEHTPDHDLGSISRYAPRTRQPSCRTSIRVCRSTSMPAAVPR
jgi:hypothetical protein